jgi:predicted nucleic-acid-binding protein
MRAFTPKRSGVMLAIDTNIVVRYLARDDPDQSARARALIDAEQVFVATTVLLETEWVLRSAYRFTGERLVAALRAFAGLPGVTLEDPALVAKALDWTERGMNFADALHLAKSGGCEAFVTFDRPLIAVARRIGAPEVRQP